MKSVVGSVVLLLGILVSTAGCGAVIGGFGPGLGDALVVALRAAPPVPADVNVQTPGSDIPVELAALSGAWLGEWSSSRRTHLLVVEEITSPEKARVVYSNGAASFSSKPEGKWVRLTARFEGGGLILKRKGGGEIVYRLNPDGKTLTVWVSEPGMKTVAEGALRRTDLTALKKEANAK
jgi:hypothetical protein